MGRVWNLWTAPLASPVAWVVSLRPVGQARLQLKSSTRNSIFLDPKLFPTIQVGRIAYCKSSHPTFLAFCFLKIGLTLAIERCAVSEDWHSTKTWNIATLDSNNLSVRFWALSEVQLGQVARPLKKSGNLTRFDQVKCPTDDLCRCYLDNK